MEGLASCRKEEGKVTVNGVGRTATNCVHMEELFVEMGAGDKVDKSE